MTVRSAMVWQSLEKAAALREFTLKVAPENPMELFERAVSITHDAFLGP